MTGAIVDAVSAAELDRHERAISQWVRLSGTADEAKAFDYIESELRAFGYDVNRYASDALIGYPGRASLTVLGAAEVEIPCNGYSLSPLTDDAGLTGELVYVGGGLDADYAGREVRGKVVLSDGLAMPNKAMAAEAAGAIGHIHINDEYIHEMCISPVWGTPIPETAGLLPKVPAVAVRSADGERLKARLAEGPTRVRLMTQPFRAWVKIPTLTGDLPGTAEGSFVLFSGHVDSWHYGAMDNGTANATQLEVARLLAERRGELRRGVRLAFWSGHSHGRYAGSSWYADEFWGDLHQRCVCHVNIDSVGAMGATVLEEAPTMAETYGFARAVLRDVLGIELDYKRMSRSSDQSFWGHGIPSVLASLSEQALDESATAAAMAQLLGSGARGGGLGWWWHTTEDTLDKIDADNFARDARVYAETLWRLCTLERLPFDYAPVADEIAAALSGFQEQARGALDLARVQTLAVELRERLRETDLAGGDVETANALQIELGRLLIPINFTAWGPFEQDLALGTRPLPGLAEATRLGRLDRESDEFRYLRTRLTRERNRVEHALGAALRAVAVFQGA